jgi:phosphoadenosine phosphosulfate reductase
VTAERSATLSHSIGTGPAIDLDALNARFAGAGAREVLLYSVERFGPGLVVACSLGVEDVVVLDTLASLGGAAGEAPDFGPRVLPRVVVLDTGRLPEPTYELLDRVRSRYRELAIDIYFPDAVAVENLVRKKGAYSFRRSVDERKECCAIRKLAPLARALTGAEAWVTGLRRAQSSTRAETALFELDTADGGRLKINPLVDWSDDDVWRYVREHEVPYNTLHDEGYPSIGCAPCTRAVLPGEDSRSGRWWWESPSSHRECGLHSPRRPRR